MEPAALAAPTGQVCTPLLAPTCLPPTASWPPSSDLLRTPAAEKGRPSAIVELALLEQAANGIALDAGQAALVRSMSLSAARMQLAIAPAGAGKTTALRA
jgi:hypothetical protein